jgi:RNA polymerase sigma factor (TIGR02999 family)
MNGAPEEPAGEVTRLLQGLGRADAAGLPPEAAERLMGLVYDSLHELARRHLRSERPDHTLQPTALVNEAYLKLVEQRRVDWQGRAHFLNVASQAIRRILVDHARARGRQKRGGEAVRVTLADDAAATAAKDADLLDLDRVLEELERQDELDHRIVMLRYFGGLSAEETARALGIGERTVQRRWTFVRSWLHSRLAGG